MSEQNTRNFVIIAHVDHGKSTLADRLLEVTGTIPARLMKPQFLDQLELERERGITIKMAPVRMHYDCEGVRYTLNLIDTPGHSDFAYEVSRALAAVEGAVLLVDATQGIQAQTIANFESARRAGLAILGAVNKVDVAPTPQVEAAVREIAALLEVPEVAIARVSAKTGTGVPALLSAIIDRVPPPRAHMGNLGLGRALVFDSVYDEHKGAMAFVRVFDGNFVQHGEANLVATRVTFKAKEVGTFAPRLTPGGVLKRGEIGYVATGIKDPDALKIGDTMLTGDLSAIRDTHTLALEGYREPKPVVFVSFYPEDPTEFDNLRQALGYLRLNDASLHFESDVSEVLGRGFKGGFLGRLHFEITADRLAREFKIETVHSFPSVAYQVKLPQNGWLTVTNPKDFPDDPQEVLEPMTSIEIIAPPLYLGPILTLSKVFRFSGLEVKSVGQKAMITASLPLADLVSDLDDKLKSLSEGFASLSYELTGYAPAEVRKLEILVAASVVPGLTRIIPEADLEREARATVERLKELLPRQQFLQAIQAASRGKIVARETIPAMKKALGDFGKNGGDRTRKMKLWKKQQEGKQRLKERGMAQPIKISASVFKELLKR